MIKILCAYVSPLAIHWPPWHCPPQQHRPRRVGQVCQCCPLPHLWQECISAVKTFPILCALCVLCGKNFRGSLRKASFTSAAEPKSFSRTLAPRGTHAPRGGAGAAVAGSTGRASVMPGRPVLPSLKEHPKPRFSSSYFANGPRNNPSTKGASRQPLANARFLDAPGCSRPFSRRKRRMEGR
jgi:hypothetical protein